MKDISLDPGTVVLVIDDDPLDCKLIRMMLEPDDVMLLEADSLKSALKLMEKNSALNVDVILLDRSLPDGDGLTLMPVLRTLPGLENVPVIIASNSFAPDQVEEALRQGAYHYLAKPFERTLLRTLIRVGVRESRDRKQLMQRIEHAEDGLLFMTRAEFEIRTFGDAKALVPFLARFFPHPESAALGTFELMINAIEHGNLEIGYDLKGVLLNTNQWSNEVERRLAMPKYRNRLARIAVERLDDRTQLTIRDDGDGFDWSKYLDISEDRISDLHGRGISLARNFCFDGLEYLGGGNEVRCWSLLDDTV